MRSCLPQVANRTGWSPQDVFFEVKRFQRNIWSSQLSGGNRESWLHWAHIPISTREGSHSSTPLCYCLLRVEKGVSRLGLYPGWENARLPESVVVRNRRWVQPVHPTSLTRACLWPLQASEVTLAPCVISVALQCV